LQSLFQYNWQVRNEWYKWCEQVSTEELLRIRTGGVGSILHTLFHIVDVEWSWIRIMQGKPDFQEDFQQYKSLDAVRVLDAKFRPEVENFVLSWKEDMEHKRFEVIYPNEKVATYYTCGEVMRHVIVHEIHHVGQLSVWSREIGKQPIAANFIGRGLLP
jgi:uncharacterized damage-inducible protein DinB